jgi:hypothetical protein
MSNPTNETKGVSPEERLQSLLATFRQVGMPLLQALVEVSGSLSGQIISEETEANRSETFTKLVDATILLIQELTKEIGGEEQLEPSVRWSLAGSASQVVAAGYHASGQVMAGEEISKLVGIASHLQERFKSQIPSGGESLPNTVATFRGKMMEAMVPVIGAVAQYAYNRGEHELLAEVAERLVKTADQVTRALASPGSTPEQWRLLCWNILRAAGQIYTDCHYAEADRLQAMDPEERAKYFAQHGDVVPMVQVWQAFNQRMAMLATLSTYLDVPATARLDEQGWS